MTAFLSTYLNRVDRKGRVSVPAAYRTALANSNFQGIIAYPSVTEPVIEAFGRDLLEQKVEERTRDLKRAARSLDEGLALER